MVRVDEGPRSGIPEIKGIGVDAVVWALVNNKPAAPIRLVSSFGIGWYNDEGATATDVAV
jgi:hypothetical protein